MVLNGRLGTLLVVSLDDCVHWAQQQVGGWIRSPVTTGGHSGDARPHSKQPSCRQ